MWTRISGPSFFMICLIKAFLTLMILAFWKTRKPYEGFALLAIDLLFMLLRVAPDHLNIFFIREWLKNRVRTVLHQFPAGWNADRLSLTTHLSGVWT